MSRPEITDFTGRVVLDVTHGGWGYTCGCRCETCTVARREHVKGKRTDPAYVEEARRKGREYMRKVHDKDPAAYNARVRASQAKKLVILLANPDHPDHGKNGSYTCGCRCAACTMARRDYSRFNRRSKR